MQRRHFKNSKSLPDRLAQEAQRLKEKAKTAPHGKERDDLIRKARQTETAVHMDQWLSSPGLQAPK